MEIIVSIEYTIIQSQLGSNIVRILLCCLFCFRYRNKKVEWKEPWKYVVPDSKVNRAYMGPTRARQDPGEPHVGPLNLAMRDGC